MKKKKKSLSRTITPLYPRHTISFFYSFFFSLSHTHTHTHTLTDNLLVQTSLLRNLSSYTPHSISPPPAHTSSNSSHNHARLCSHQQTEARPAGAGGEGRMMKAAAGIFCSDPSGAYNPRPPPPPPLGLPFTK